MHVFTFDASIQGVTHQHRNVPRQDASASLDAPKRAEYVFAVADGHGDASCVRSDIGSRLAVEVTVSYLSKFASDMYTTDTLDADVLRSSIVGEWRKRVRDHYRHNPLTSTETDVQTQYDETVNEQQCVRLYGTTLVAGIKCGSRLILLQQGDGCCVLIDGEGRLSCPIPDDALCVGEVTTSMCDEDAARRMRIVVIDISQTGHAACFVGTDGVDKSLGDDGLLSFCGKVALDALGNPTREAMETLVQSYLLQLSANGSGDDASLAGCVDVDAIATCAYKIVSSRNDIEQKLEREQIRQRLVSMQRRYERYKEQPPEHDDDAEERMRFMAEYEQLRKQIDVRDASGSPVDVPQASNPETEHGNSANKESEINTRKSQAIQAADEQSLALRDMRQGAPKREAEGKTEHSALLTRTKQYDGRESIGRRRSSHVLFALVTLLVAVLSFGGGMLVDRMFVRKESIGIPSEQVESEQTSAENMTAFANSLDAKSLSNCLSEVRKELAQRRNDLRIQSVLAEPSAEFAYDKSSGSYELAVIVKYMLEGDEASHNESMLYRHLLNLSFEGSKLIVGQDQLDQIAQVLPPSPGSNETITQ